MPSLVFEFRPCSPKVCQDKLFARDYRPFRKALLNCQISKITKQNVNKVSQRLHNDDMN